MNTLIQEQPGKRVCFKSSVVVIGNIEKRRVLETEISSGTYSISLLPDTWYQLYILVKEQ